MDLIREEIEGGAQIKFPVDEAAGIFYACRVYTDRPDQPRFMRIDSDITAEFISNGQAVAWIPHMRENPIIPEIAFHIALVSAPAFDRDVSGNLARESAAREGLSAMAREIFGGEPAPEEFVAWTQMVHEKVFLPLVPEDNHESFDHLKASVATRNANSPEEVVRYGVWDSEVPGTTPCLVKIFYGGANHPNRHLMWTRYGFVPLPVGDQPSLISQFCSALRQSPRRWTLLSRLAEQVLSPEDQLIFNAEHMMIEFAADPNSQDETDEPDNKNPRL